MNLFVMLVKVVFFNFLILSFKFVGVNLSVWLLIWLNVFLCWCGYNVMLYRVVLKFVNKILLCKYLKESDWVLL